MGNEINRSLFNHHHRLNWFWTIILAFSMINFLLMGESYGFVDTWNVHPNEDEVQRTTTKPISSSPHVIVVSTPVQSSANQTLKATREIQPSSSSSEFSQLTTTAIEIQASEVWEEEPRTAPFYRQFSSTTADETWNHLISPSPSSSYLNIYQTEELYLNSASETADTLTSSHQTSDFQPFSELVTVSGNNKHVSLTETHSQNHLKIYSTPTIEHQPTAEDALKVQSVAPTPPSWNMAEATVAQGAMTWITSQPSSAGHLQSEFHMPAGTVAGIVVASVAFVGLVAAALGFFALRRLRPLHTKTYDTNYAGDTFSYLDNLQVSYINHHVELPKEASDEMFSLDNDSFLNSLEAMTMENYWAEESKSTKV